MSIKYGLLALLDHGPRYGYQLRSEFEAHTGSTWPLNVGQVYTTLGRLDRDGLVEPDGEDVEGHVFYKITGRGRLELRAWFEAPVSRTNPPRDELAIKLAMAVTVPGIDVAAVVQRQRAHTLRALQDYTRLKTGASRDDLAWQLVLESLIFHAEAEVRWLDHCEARLARQAAERTPLPPVDAPTPSRVRKARR
jgi:DNA-binding PadR family transcriptional regulator